MLIRVLATVCCAAAIVSARALIAAQTLRLVRLHLGEVAGRDDDDEHEEDEDDHDVEAELAAHLDLARDAAAVGALAAEALSCTLALIKVDFHALLANCRTPSAVSERAARFRLAIRVDLACFDALNDWRADVRRAAPREALEAVVAMVKRLLLSLVADGPRHAAALAAAESRAVAVCVVGAGRTDLVVDVFKIRRVRVGVRQRLLDRSCR